LLLECIRLFREQPEVLRGYQARFKYILVDEYQDTNVAQYLWLRLLGQSTTIPGTSKASKPDDPGLVLRDAAQSAAPQDEDRDLARRGDQDLPRSETPDPRPEERGDTPRVSKG